ncbi:MAG TPA: DUF4386 domain-containing protein [Thermoanaerobaculia bacterium]|nr:DUF4386 domain-containing protein [Thermoanaerobaculia bacterium]
MSTALMDLIAEPSPRFKATRATVLCVTAFLMAAAAAFVRFKLVVPADPTATATNILAHEPLFRMLFAADLISASCYVAVTLLFHEMFKSVDERLSVLTAFLGLASGTIVAFGCLFHFAALLILKGAQSLNILSLEPLPALVLRCLQLQAQAHGISLALFGFYCVLLGYLIVRSTFLPRFLGAAMAIAGLGWLAFVSPQLAHQLSPSIVGAALLAEGTLILWLLVIGVNGHLPHLALRSS